LYMRHSMANMCVPENDDQAERARQIGENLEEFEAEARAEEEAGQVRAATAAVEEAERQEAETRQENEQRQEEVRQITIRGY
ncbi:MAG: hypothetical protein Q9221_006000, partial [Calogaya cf. arnoldii]